MPDTQSLPPKPIAENYRPDIVELPRLTRSRRLVRLLLIACLRLLIWLFIRLDTKGRENIPREGGLLVVSNHLGDADILIGVAITPRPLDVFVKAEFYDHPVLGKLIDAYGVIWIHRGHPDRRAIRAGLQGLQEGRMVVIAPEGRESVTGALEEGTFGAAYLALKSGAPVLPATLTGTANDNLYGNLRRLRRTYVTLTFGTPFKLKNSGDWRSDIENGTEQMMSILAKQLPPEYRGVYRQDGDDDGGG